MVIILKALTYSIQRGKLPVTVPSDTTGRTYPIGIIYLDATYAVVYCIQLSVGVYRCYVRADEISDSGER